jgi:hypothetical protein
MLEEDLAQDGSWENVEKRNQSKDGDVFLA